MKLQTVSLRRSDHLNEKWLQEQIADDPSILGLGDLVLKDKERIVNLLPPDMSLIPDAGNWVSGADIPTRASFVADPFSDSCVT